MKNPKSFYKKLKKLIEEEIPDDCQIVFDYMESSIYVVKKDAKFIDNDLGLAIGGESTSTPKNSMGYSNNTGLERNKVIGDSISIEMTAVQK